MFVIESCQKIEYNVLFNDDIYPSLKFWQSVSSILQDPLGIDNIRQLYGFGVNVYVFDILLWIKNTETVSQNLKTFQAENLTNDCTIISVALQPV